MAKIRVLNEATINQIAAGEVIENPSSVVKELVENSLDAGAARIWIEIRGGGFELIQVADDGSGMSRDDAVLCFERHATSKMGHIDDLSSLCSMGFRGEALASIAAISRTELISAEEGKDATEVKVEGGVIRDVHPASRSRGTTIIVRSLFYNVPARKKFQKSVAASTSAIHKLLFSQALAHPEVGFELIAGGKTLLSLAPESHLSPAIRLKNRIETVFDPSFIQGCRPASLEESGHRLHGFLGAPAHDRINRSGQYLYINRRTVVSPLVSSAVKMGYGHRLNEQRYPVFVLHLSIPPELLDVNVHPQKREVRFQNEEWVRQFLKTAIQTAFLDKEEPSQRPNFVWSGERGQPEIPSLQFREEKQQGVVTWIEEPEVIGLYAHYLLLDGATVPGKGEGIVWVNLQKAEEAMLLKNLTQAIGHSQGLLIPIPLSLNREEQASLENLQSVLRDMGFAIEPSGKENYLIQAIPSWLEAGDAVEAALLALQGEDMHKKLAAFAVRKKKRFMIQEALALWQQVKNSVNPEIIATIGPHEIEHLFR